MGLKVPQENVTKLLKLLLIIHMMVLEVRTCLSEYQLVQPRGLCKQNVVESC